MQRSLEEYHKDKAKRERNWTAYNEEIDNLTRKFKSPKFKDKWPRAQTRRHMIMQELFAAAERFHVDIELADIIAVCNIDTTRIFQTMKAYSHAYPPAVVRRLKESTGSKTTKRELMQKWFAIFDAEIEGKQPDERAMLEEIAKKLNLTTREVVSKANMCHCSAYFKIRRPEAVAAENIDAAAKYFASRFVDGTFYPPMSRLPHEARGFICQIFNPPEIGTPQYYVQMQCREIFYSLKYGVTFGDVLTHRKSLQKHGVTVRDIATYFRQEVDGLSDEEIAKRKYRIPEKWIETNLQKATDYISKSILGK